MRRMMLQKDIDYVEKMKDMVDEPSSGTLEVKASEVSVHGKVKVSDAASIGLMATNQVLISKTGGPVVNIQGNTVTINADKINLNANDIKINSSGLYFGKLEPYLYIDRPGSPYMVIPMFGAYQDNQLFGKYRLKNGHIIPFSWIGISPFKLKADALAKINELKGDLSGASISCDFTDGTEDFYYVAGPWPAVYNYDFALMLGKNVFKWDNSAEGLVLQGTFTPLDATDVCYFVAPKEERLYIEV